MGSGFRNDRYVDLAVVANFVVTNDAEEESYLHTYFGEAASDYRRARFYLMRQLLHMFYPAALILFGLKGKAVQSKEKVPDFRDFHTRIWKGELSLATDEAKLQYARVHMKQNLADIGTARFQDALRLISGRGKQVFGEIKQLKP